MALTIQIKVTPNASKNQIIGFTDGILKVRIRGVPEKGLVNKELIKFLAEVLGIAKSQIELLSEGTSRLKKLKIEGINEFPKIES